MLQISLKEIKPLGYIEPIFIFKVVHNNEIIFEKTVRTLKSFINSKEKEPYYDILLEIENRDFFVTKIYKYHHLDKEEKPPYINPDNDKECYIFIVEKNEDVMEDNFLF